MKLVYLDISVILAQLWAEDRVPPQTLWARSLVSSRLLEYETWTRIHAKGLAASHGDAARSLLGRVSFLELVEPVLTRALDLFPAPVRTLDALHLASLEFLRGRKQRVELASYDRRMCDAARALGIPIANL